MKVNNNENKIESGMEGLNIGEEHAVKLDQAADKPKMRRGWRHHKCSMHEAADPEAKQHWREMRHQRMAMRQAMRDGAAWGGFPMMHGHHGPYGMMMPPPMMYGFPPHQGPHHGRRHFHNRFSPMMYAGPQSNQFEGDFGPAMGGRPPFHPGMMAMMMMPMFAGMGFHGKQKGKKSNCDNKTEPEADATKEQSEGKSDFKKGESFEGMPPFMMAPWMFKGQKFRKCMDKDSCCQNATNDNEDAADKGNKEQTGMEGKSEAHTASRGEKFGPKHQMRIMKRIMAMNGGFPPMMTMNGGFPPMMAMHPGAAMYQPGMMHRFMQKQKCQHKKKGDKSESDESPSSGDEIEIIHDHEDILKDNVANDATEGNIGESSEAFEMLGASSNVNDDANAENENDTDQKEHKKKWGHHHHRRQQMRAMMMNGGFPPMWAMMSHGGFNNQCQHKGRKGKSQESPDVEKCEKSGEEKMMS